MSIAFPTDRDHDTPEFAPEKPERNQLMWTVKRSLLTLLIVPTVLGATVHGLAIAARAHQPVATQASLQGRWLEVRGSNFAPGTRVSIALISTRTWRPLLTGSTTAEATTYPCPRGTSIMCGQRDPNAGHLSFETRLQRPIGPGNLVVLYRFGTEVGLSRVREQ